MASKSTIHLNWSRLGQVMHHVSGYRPPPPRDDALAWLLAPSGPLLLAHQFGAMKPSHALIVSGWVIDTLFHNRYVIMPINSALSSATIEFIYTGGPAVKVQFHPKHSVFANSDSVEEGVRQLINNYTHYVYSKLDDYLRIVFRTFAVTATGMYYDFLQDQFAAGTLRKGLDRWTLDFPIMAAGLISAVSTNYYVPEGGHTSDNEEWARKQTDHLREQLSKLMAMRDSILTAMGMY